MIVEKAATHADLQAQGDDYADNSKAAFEEFVSQLKTVRLRGNAHERP